MNTAILKESGAFLVGLVAAAGGVPGAALGAAVSGAALLAETAGWFSKFREDRRRVERAQEAFGKRFRRERGLSDTDAAVMDGVLQTAMHGFQIEREELRTLLRRGRFEDDASGALMARIGLQPGQYSDSQTDYLRGMIAAGLQAAAEGDRLHRILMQESVSLLLEANEGRLPRSLLENLVQRFGHDNPDAPIPQLETFLKDKAQEWKDLKALAAKLDEGNARIANVRAAVEAAIEVGDFAGARARLDDALEIQVKETAVAALRPAVEMYGLKAETWLLEGDADAAAESFEAGAMLFTGLDRMEEAKARYGGAIRLYRHGLRYGGVGLVRAIRSFQVTSEIYTREAQPVAWSATQNNLATALWAQAARVEGAAGADLLAEAVTAYRAALEVRTREAQPVDWAMTQNNLAVALQAQAARVEGAAGADLQAKAVTAYRAALEVRTREAYPLDWATTQINLAAALWAQAARVEGAARADLLAKAVTAYRAALEVRTREAHPLHWAGTQNNLALAHQSQAATVEGAEVVDLLAKAVTAYRAALEVYTREAHPVNWATTQNNLANALRAQSARVAGAELLAEAVTAYRAALEVRTREAHPVDWAMTQENLGLVFEDMGNREMDGRAARYGEALGCFEAALEVFDPVHMGPNHAKCMGARDRVKGKLDGLGA